MKVTSFIAIFISLLIVGAGGDFALGADRNPANAPTEPKNLFKDLDYPELQVVPRASDRLKEEAKHEQHNWYYVNWPMHLSALATLTVGLYGSSGLKEGLSGDAKDNAELINAGAIGVGIGWLATNLLISGSKPYLKGYKQVVARKGKSKRDQLFRERVAEEALEKPAKLYGPLTWISVITNAGISIAAGSQLDTTGAIIAASSTFLAFFPIMFDNHYEQTYEKHIEYKKKIYAPVSSVGIGYDRVARTYHPTWNLDWSF